MTIITGIADWGPLTIATDVDDAILAQLKTWLPTYIHQMTKERNLSASLPLPKFYGNTLEDDEFLDHNLPAVIVTTAEAGKVDGGPNSIYTAQWDVKISLIVRGRIPKETRYTAALLEGALRRCVLQKCRQNPGPLNDMEWVDMKIAPVKDNSEGQGRYLAAALGTYNAITDKAVQSFGGPDVPDADNYVPLATVTDVVIDVESEE